MILSSFDFSVTPPFVRRIPDVMQPFVRAGKVDSIFRPRFVAGGVFATPTGYGVSFQVGGIDAEGLDRATLNHISKQVSIANRSLPEECLVYEYLVTASDDALPARWIENDFVRQQAQDRMDFLRANARFKSVQLIITIYLSGKMPTDMGAGADAVAHRWFNSMFASVDEMGVAFTAIGIVTPDPASVESVLGWAKALQHRVSYLIVKNALSDPADFSYWENDAAAVDFRRIFSPKEISMEYRLPKVENPARQHGLTLNRIADRQADVRELQQTTVVIRAQAYRRHLFAQLDQVRDLLLV